MARLEREVVWLASYPRSGNSWVRFLFGAYANGGEADSWRVCNYAITEVQHSLGEAQRDGLDDGAILRRVEEKLDRFAPPTYRPPYVGFKTHYKWSAAHPFGERTGKAIYLLRHPKDVLLSAINYHQLKKREDLPSPAEVARRFIEAGGDPIWVQQGFGTWIEHYLSWNDHPSFPVLLIRYEDLKRDTLGEFLQMLAFLDVPIDEEQARRAVEQTSLQELRRLEVQAREKGRFFDAKEGRYFIHKGASGQSLHPLGKGLEEAFVERFTPWLEAAGYHSAETPQPTEKP